MYDLLKWLKGKLILRISLKKKKKKKKKRKEKVNQSINQSKALKCEMKSHQTLGRWLYSWTTDLYNDKTDLLLNNQNWYMTWWNAL